MNRSVNLRQLEILQWIADGCPDRAWRDESHKHSARALQNRGLAKVSRVKGRWSATITDAGRHFLAHGDYPPSTTTPTPTRKTARPRRAAKPDPVSESVPSAEQTAPLGPPAPTEAQLLYLRLVRAGGRLEIADRDLGRAAQELQEARLAPPGQVLRTRRRGWHHQLLYFVDDPQVAVPTRTLDVPSRLTRAHPVARQYRDDRDHHEVATQHLPRAVRIVHALATAFDELGLTMTLETRRTPDGQFHVRGEGWGVSLRLSEKSAPGGDPLPPYLARRGKALPAWQARRQKQFISTGRLTIQVGGAYATSGGRQLRFRDTRTHQLEDVLPGVVREVEMRFFERRQEAEEASREAQEQQERWERVLDDAQRRAAEAHRAETLADRATAWSRWREQTAYVDHLEEHLAQLSERERPEAEEWITWLRRHLADTDPMRGALAMPAVPAPTKEFLTPHIRNWPGPLKDFRA